MQIDSQALPAHGINPRINTALRSLPLAINTAWGSIPRLNQNPNLLKQIKKKCFQPALAGLRRAAWGLIPRRNANYLACFAGRENKSADQYRLGINPQAKPKPKSAEAD